MVSIVQIVYFKGAGEKCRGGVYEEEVDTLKGGNYKERQESLERGITMRRGSGHYKVGAL